MSVLSQGHRQIILVRSGHTAWSSEGRFVGTQDLDLNKEGVQTASTVAEELIQIRPTAILTSDLQRAISTSAPLERLSGLSANRDRRLRPLHASGLEGLKVSEVSERYPGEAGAWEQARKDVLPPGGGESRWEVGSRARDCILEALMKDSEDTILIVVTHDLTARAAICAFLDLPDPGWGIFEEMSHCAWSTLRERRRGGWFVSEYNVKRLRPSGESDEFPEDKNPFYVS